MNTQHNENIFAKKRQFFTPKKQTNKASKLQRENQLVHRSLCFHFLVVRLYWFKELKQAFHMIATIAEKASVLSHCRVIRKP